MCSSTSAANSYKLVVWQSLLQETLSDMRPRLDIRGVNSHTLQVDTLRFHIVLLGLVFGGVAKVPFGHVRARFSGWASPIPTLLCTKAKFGPRSARSASCVGAISIASQGALAAIGRRAPSGLRVHRGHQPKDERHAVLHAVFLRVAIGAQRGFLPRHGVSGPLAKGSDIELSRSGITQNWSHPLPHDARRRRWWRT